MFRKIFILTQRGMVPQSTILSFCFILLTLAGCGSLGGPEARLKMAEDLAHQSGFQSLILPTSEFNLKAYARCAVSQAHEAYIYLEGDGFAWATRTQPSSDPTPRDPVALRLALEDSRACVIYLARPCQYLTPEGELKCTKSFWTSARYHEAVAHSMDQAISDLKTRYPFKKIHLLGYSGGGVMAALIAARRSDVVSLTTFAANMDTDYWTKLHDVAPLTESLNPAHFGESLKKIPQIHYVGSEDEVVPESVLQSYEAALGKESQSRHFLISGMSHDGDWAAFWKKELKKSPGS